MPLPPNFPESPRAILDSGKRWLPDESGVFEQMMPPLVQKLRKAEKVWWNDDY